jgi:hypothetical protein
MFNAAEAIAKPFPVAAVVLPTESKNICSCTYFFYSLISAHSTLLSEIGPERVYSLCIVAIIAEAAKATP